MKFRYSLLILFLFSCFSLRAQFCVPEEGQAFYSRAVNEINPRHINWVKAVLTDLKSGKTTDDGIEAEGKRYGNLGNLADGDIMALCFIVMMEASKSAQEDLKAVMAGVKEMNKQKAALREALGMINKRAAEQKSKKRTDYMNRKEYDSLKKILSAATVIQTAHLNLPKLDSVKRLPGAVIIDNAAVKNIDTRIFPVTAAEVQKLQDDYRDKLDSMNELGEMQSLRLQMVMDRMSKFMSMLSNLFKKFSTTQDQIVQNLK